VNTSLAPNLHDRQPRPGGRRGVRLYHQSR
jgi:hypothetical protein